MNANRDKLATAFRELRKQGILARQNFMCCSSCAGAALREKLTAKHSGYAFYHRQDTAGISTSGGCYLAFGSAKSDPTENDVAAVGTKVTAVLRAQGLAYEWDGTANSRIWVTVDPELQAECEAEQARQEKRRVAWLKETA